VTVKKVETRKPLRRGGKNREYSENPLKSRYKNLKITK